MIAALMSSSIRKEKADARRSMIMALTDQVVSILRESGATEEESSAALECARIIVPLQEMNRWNEAKHIGV